MVASTKKRLPVEYIIKLKNNIKLNSIPKKLYYDSLTSHLYKAVSAKQIQIIKYQHKDTTSSKMVHSTMSTIQKLWLTWTRSMPTISASYCAFAPMNSAHYQK